MYYSACIGQMGQLQGIPFLFREQAQWSDESGKPNLDRFGAFGEPDLVNSLLGFALDQYSLGHFDRLRLTKSRWCELQLWDAGVNPEKKEISF